MHAPAVKYQEPKLSREKRAAIAAGKLDFLLPGTSATVSTAEAARVLRGDKRKLSYVYSLIQRGKLETLGPREAEKSRVSITRRSLLVRIAEEFDGDAGELAQRVADLAPLFDGAQSARIAAAFAARARETA
jgi:hypothetical protein